MRFGQSLIQGLIDPGYSQGLFSGAEAMGQRMAGVPTEQEQAEIERVRKEQQAQQQAALERSRGLLTGNLLNVSDDMLQPSVNAALATGVAPTAVNSLLNQRRTILEGQEAQEEKLRKQAEDQAVLQLAIQDAEAKGDQEQVQALTTNSITGQDYFRANADPVKRLDVQIRAINLAQQKRDQARQNTLSNIYKAIETSLAQGADYEAIEANAPAEYKAEVREYLSDIADHRRKITEVAEAERAFTESELSDLISVVGQETVDFYQKMAKQRPDKANQWLSTRVAAGLESMRASGKNSDGSAKAPSSWEVDSAETLVNEMVNINPLLMDVFNREGVELSDSQKLQLYYLVASWRKTNPGQNLTEAKLNEIVTQVKEEAAPTPSVESSSMSNEQLMERLEALRRLQKSGNL